jgi:hypothetical protein
VIEGTLYLVPTAGAPTLRVHRVSSLEDRVRLLQKLVNFGEAAFDKSSPPFGSIRDPEMRRIGLAVTEVCKARDDRCELMAIYDFVKRNIRYTGDVTNKDTFQSAYRTMQMGGGDCDDFSILIAVLSLVNGFQTKFRITSNYGSSWDHIMCLAGLPKLEPRSWIVLDATLPGSTDARFGKQPPAAKYRDFSIDP